MMNKEKKLKEIKINEYSPYVKHGEWKRMAEKMMLIMLNIFFLFRMILMIFYELFKKRAFFFA